MIELFGVCLSVLSELAYIFFPDSHCGMYYCPYRLFGCRHRSLGETGERMGQAEMTSEKWRRRLEETELTRKSL